MKQLVINKDIEYVRQILSSIESNNGYCCCQLIKNEKSMCPFSFYYLPNALTSNLLCEYGSEQKECICGIYV